MENLKTAGVIIIGDEVLKGQVADTNSSFLSQRFHALGVRLRKISVIPDSIDEIAEEVSHFAKKYDIVITTGGVGPTHDDVTYLGVAKAFREPLVVSQILLNYWFRYYPQKSRKLTGPAEKMATIPQSAVVNHTLVSKSLISEGKFPIVSVSNVYIFPGIPSYVKAAFTGMEDLFAEGSTKFYCKQIYLNIDEVEPVISALNRTVEAFKDKVEIGSYPILDNPVYRTKITLESICLKDCDEAYSMLVSLLKDEWIVQDGNLIGNAVSNLNSLIASGKLGKFTDHLKHSIEVIEQCFKEHKQDEVFLSFNGGKDCTALLHLVYTVLSKKYKCIPKLQAVYFQSKNPFPETEEFIEKSRSRYNLELTIVPGPIKEALSLLLKEKPYWKVVLMGTRRTDPFSNNLLTFQETDSGWPKLLRVHPFLDWGYQDVWKFLIELSIPYCSLYDQGGNKKLLKDAIQIAEEMEGIVSVPFGPEGKGVLCDIRGNIFISKCGYDILDKVYDRSVDSVTDLILASACEISTQLGDGVKTFILIFTSLLRGCLSFKNNHSVYRQLSTFMFHLDLVVSECVPKNEDKIDLIAVIRSFFQTRFLSHEHEILSSLLIDWVSQNNFVDSNYEYLLDYSDTLCISGEGLLSDSKVEKGVWISGEFYGKFTFDKMKCTLKVLFFSDNDSKSEDDVISNFSFFLREIDDTEHNKILLATNVNIPETCRCKLRTLGIQFLHCISLEDAKFLFEYSLLYSVKNKNNVEIEFYRDEFKHKTKLWLSLEVAQLKICCLKTEFASAYLNSIKNCLKLCQTIISKKSLLIPSGKFENILALYFASFYGNEFCVPASNRTELLVWIEAKQEVEKKLQSWRSDEPKISKEATIENLEIIIMTILKTLKKRCLSLNEDIVKIICESLTSVSKKIPVNAKADSAESLYLKFAVFQKALASLVLFLNLNGIVKMKRSQK